MLCFKNQIWDYNFQNLTKRIELLKSMFNANNLRGVISFLKNLDTLSLQKNVNILSGTLLNKYYYEHATDDRIDKIMDFLYKNYHKKITAIEVADPIFNREEGFSRF